MIRLAPAIDVGTTAPLARLGAADLTWWVVVAEDGAVSAQEIGRTVADLLTQFRTTAGDAWVAMLEGSSEAIRYAESTIGGWHSAPSRAPRRLVLTDLDDAGALSLLDATSVAPMDLLLVLAPPGAASSVAASLADGAPSEDMPPLRLVVFIPMRGQRAALGWPHGVSLPSASGVRTSSTPERLQHPPQPKPARDGAWRHHMTAISIIMIAVLLSAAGATAWRMTAGTTPPPRAATDAGVPRANSSPIPAVPSSSLGPTLAYDAGDGDAVLFGGIGNDASTWLWSAQRWHFVPESVAPEGRFGAAAAYDPAMHAVLLYGGRLSGGQVMNDTWTLRESKWNRLDAGALGPPPGEFATMAWDEARGTMLLLAGGPGATPGAEAETWELDGSTWRPRRSPDLPSLEVRHVMAYDPASRTVLMVTVGGTQADPYSPSETWSWDGTWHQLRTVHVPRAGFPSALGLDPRSGRLILVGPSREQFNSAVETWSWDGSDWTLIGQGEDPPAPLAVVPLGGDGMLEAIGWSQGGGNSPLGVWGWTGRTWVQLADGRDTAQLVQGPSSRQFAAAAYDPVRRALVAYGGVSGGNAATPGVRLDDTWVFNGREWRRVQTATHPPASGRAAFDPVTQTVVLVSDGAGFGPPDSVLTQPETWSWDGTDWRAVHPAAELPHGSLVSAMVSDPATRTLVAIVICCQQANGQLSGPRSPTTWLWNGHTWAAARPPVEFAGGIECRLAFDPVSRQVVGVGNDGTPAPVPTWAWDGRTWRVLHPTHDATFDPLTSLMAGDPYTQSVVLLSRKFQTAETFEDAGGTQVWDGKTWTHHVDLVVSDADTAYGDAALFPDDALGGLVLLSGGTQGFQDEWVWTGAAWMQLELQPGPPGAAR